MEEGEWRGEGMPQRGWEGLEEKERDANLLAFMCRAVVITERRLFSGF